MSDNYLWDRSGEADPEIERLEQLLRPFRHNQPLRAVGRTPNWVRFATAAAAIVAVVSSGLYLLRRPDASGWAVANVEGAPRVEARPVQAGSTIPKGQWLQTDENSRVRLAVGKMGELRVDPNSRLRIVKSTQNESRMELQRGVIHAFIWAPPRQFFINTPSAVAVDLGCKYTLEVGDSGDGLLKVELGWVAFEAGGHETFIPAEAACKTWKQTGPGLPYYLDASEAFQSAVNQFKEDNDNAPLSTLLAEARPRDAMTLWHLLPRVKGQARELVYERMAALTNPPAGVERAGVLALNQPMLDAWWDSWGIDNANWWRRWKGQWPSR